jgi:YgiT-type zinc finger domain-containing protein
MINKEDYCEFCDGIAKPARVKHSFERHGKDFEFKNIPALKCEKCGAVYLDGLATQKIEKQIAKEIYAAV